MRECSLQETVYQIIPELWDSLFQEKLVELTEDSTVISQPAFAYSKLTIEALEQIAEYVQR